MEEKNKKSKVSKGVYTRGILEKLAFTAGGLALGIYLVGSFGNLGDKKSYKTKEQDYKQRIEGKIDSIKNTLEECCNIKYDSTKTKDTISVIDSPYGPFPLEKDSSLYNLEIKPIEEKTAPIEIPKEETYGPKTPKREIETPVKKPREFYHEETQEKTKSLDEKFTLKKIDSLLFAPQNENEFKTWMKATEKFGEGEWTWLNGELPTESNSYYEEILVNIKKRFGQTSSQDNYKKTFDKNCNQIKSLRKDTVHLGNLLKLQNLPSKKELEKILKK